MDYIASRTRKTENYNLYRPSGSINAVNVSVNNSCYQQFIMDINSVLVSDDIFVSICTDNTGSTIVKDTNGNNINELQIASVSYSYPYITLQGQTMPGYFILSLINTATLIIADDTTTKYWYAIRGVNDLTSLKELNPTINE
jgi:hypothetical protein